MILIIAIILSVGWITAVTIMAVYSIKDFYDDRKAGRI